MTAFCQKCESNLEKSLYYCPKCGAPVPPVGSGVVTKTEVNLKDNGNPVPKLEFFNSFRARKESERQSFFSGRKSKRVKTGEKEVTINVGIMKDKDTIMRGEKRPVKVLPSATAADILRSRIRIRIRVRVRIRARVRVRVRIRVRVRVRVRIRVRIRVRVRIRLVSNRWRRKLAL